MHILQEMLQKGYWKLQYFHKDGARPCAKARTLLRAVTGMKVPFTAPDTAQVRQGPEVSWLLRELYVIHTARKESQPNVTQDRDLDRLNQ